MELTCYYSQGVGVIFPSVLWYSSKKAKDGIHGIRIIYFFKTRHKKLPNHSVPRASFFYNYLAFLHFWADFHSFLLSAKATDSGSKV